MSVLALKINSISYALAFITVGIPTIAAEEWGPEVVFDVPGFSGRSCQQTLQVPARQAC